MSKYRAIAWNVGDDVTVEKMQTISENMEYLKESRISGRYEDDTARVSTGLKLIAGRVWLPKKKTFQQSADVSFNNSFSPGCWPIVTTGTTTRHERGISITHSGRASYRPSHDGMTITAHLNGTSGGTKNFDATVAIDWMALGY